MRRTPSTRLDRLEQRIGGRCERIILARHVDMPTAEALAMLGLEPGERDMVVVVKRRRPDAVPELLSREPMAA